ncbi:hypothetical protein H4582DRAFT_1993184, partial [Lactarius indigo]
MDQGSHKDRTGNFSGGHFADVNLTSVLFTHRLDDSKHIELRDGAHQHDFNLLRRANPSGRLVSGPSFLYRVQSLVQDH